MKLRLLLSPAMSPQAILSSHLQKAAVPYAHLTALLSVVFGGLCSTRVHHTVTSGIFIKIAPRLRQLGCAKFG
jgi:hypothetical protein